MSGNKKRQMFERLYTRNCLLIANYESTHNAPNKIPIQRPNFFQFLTHLQHGLGGMHPQHLEVLEGFVVEVGGGDALQLHQG